MINKFLSNKALNNNSGITLVALVITIVVLIILATISINVAIQGGIIESAKKSKNIHEQAATEEQAKLDGVTNDIRQHYTNTAPVVTYIDDGKGGTIPLPDGFYYVGGNLDDGIVISDKHGDSLDASGTEMGNQFVWIPVSDESQLAPISTEPYANGYDEETAEYDTMRTQVLKYHGFYIGRFEAGVNDTTLRTKVTENQAVVCKRGVAPYNFISWGPSIKDINTSFKPTENNPDNVNTNGAVYLAKNFASQKGYTSVVSTLTYGHQWNIMYNYANTATRTTPTKTGPGLTGSVTGDVAKNIYDLAGNCSEWTMELDSSGTKRVGRCGSYEYAGPVSHVSKLYTTYSYNTTTFRISLYIK